MAQGPSVFSTIQPSFNAGELSPLLFGRVDIDKYKSGLALARNVYIDYRGGASNRAGTQFIGAVDGTSGNPRGIPFIVNTETSYSVVFTGNGMIQFFSNGVYVGGADIASPYAQADIPLIKFTQSADVMTLTHPLYPPYNLTRTGPSTFSIVEDVIFPVMQPPQSLAARPQSTSDTNIVYTYMVTAVSASEGAEESLPTTPIFAPGEGNTSVPAVQVALSWQPPSSGGTVAYYKIYKAPPFINRGVSGGALAGVAPSVYGYIGQSVSTSYNDSIQTPDFTQTPPSFQDPFSPGQIASVQPDVGSFTGYGSAFFAPLVFTGGTPVRSGAGYAIVDAHTNQPVGVVLTDPGKGYVSPPVVTDSVGNATYTVTMGQTSGTFPGSVTYFQQRRTFGGTLNFPESFTTSHPGLYNNFNTNPISLASDSITASIASQQNNTIRAMTPMSTGLVVFTYGSAFLVTGGSQGNAVTPLSIVALPQASFGASDLPPIPVNYTVLYTESLGFTVRDLTFNFYNQSYVGVDRSILSSHLFFGYTFNDWAFAQAPFRTLLMTRNDGQLVVLTYVPEQELFAWTHYDTNGLFISVWTVPEGQTNTVYAIVKRFIQGSQTWVYYLERFVERNFNYPIDLGMWFVDAGLALPQGQPTATLQPSAPVLGVTNLSYSGSLGVTAHVGDVVQAYGTQIALTHVAGGVLTGTIVSGSLPTIPNDPFNTPIPLTPGNVTLTTPVTTVSGLTHLNGMQVTGMADGVVVTPRTVVAGSITLDAPATSVLIGLGFTAQLQTLRLTAGGQQTEEGKRKNIPAITIREYLTSGIQIGRDLQHLGPQRFPANAGPQVQLLSDDIRTIIGAHWDKDGQFAIQQSLPLPMTILADIPEVLPGDTYRG